MDLPSTIYIGIGAVIAAIITGIISFINLVASKDQKTSEFRQQWIDGLRKDITEYLSHVDSVSCQAHLYHQIGGPEGITADLLKDFSENVSVNMNKAAQLYHSIQLRLNVKDDRELLRDLKAVNDLLRLALNNLHDYDNFKELTNPVVLHSQKLLKSEWKRVKRGEPAFYITKYIVVGIILTFSIFITLYLKDFIKISIV
jgi:hypothetical protein